MSWGRWGLTGCGCSCAPSCPVTICAVSCVGGAAISGATVEVRSGGVAIASGTTDASGCVALSIPSAGTYEVDVSAAGFVASNAAYALSCNGTLAVQLGTTPAVQFTIKGCCGLLLPGATVTFAGGTYGPSDASGHVNIGVQAPGTYSYSISKSRFGTATGNVTIAASCAAQQNVNVTLSPATGYVCFSVNCPDPIPTTLHLTDSIYGAVVLTYAGLATWSGSLSVSYPGCGACPAKTVDVTYTMAGDELGAADCSQFFSLSLSYKCTGAPCPDPAGTGNCTNPNNLSLGQPDTIPFDASGSSTGATIYCTHPISYTVTE